MGHRIDCQGREVIFWNIESYAEDVLRALEPYFATQCSNGVFHYYWNKNLTGISRNKSYLLFYKFSDKESENAARRLVRCSHFDICFAALCSNYREGIESMEQGDCYALQVPLKPEKVVECYRHCNVVKIV